MPEIIPVKYVPDRVGRFVTARLTGTVLTFDEYPGREIDLADLQEAGMRRLRISVDWAGRISIDAPEDHWLIATIDLPAAAYVSEPVPGENGEAVWVDTRVPVTADDIELTVWRLPE